VRDGREFLVQALFNMDRLKRRADFRAVAAGVRASGNAFVLQSQRRTDEDGIRVGFTVSRQVGNAVERNRVRRRLRELVRLANAESLRGGHDYVLIGRRPALRSPFGDMIREFDKALGRVHAREAEELVARANGPYMKPVQRPMVQRQMVQQTMCRDHGPECAAPSHPSIE
jgi:ribonuclease P protein component